MSTSTRRRQLLQLSVVAGILLVFASGAAAQPTSPILERHEGDDYTRYELLAPESAQFRITYEVTATKPGARYFFNIIRKGSEASDEAVFDQTTGLPLPWKVVTGAEARAAGQANADLEANYIQVTLARPVPAGGEARLRIDKTYRDAKSYYRDGDAIVFARGLGIKRNAVVLPAGYELVGLQRAVPDPHGARRTHRHQLPEHLPRGGASRRQGAAAGEGTGAASRRRGSGIRKGTDAGAAGRRVRGSVRGGAPERTRAPGPRDRVLPAAAGHACLRALSRLHRVASRRRRVLQRRARRQPGVEPRGASARHRRGTESRDAQGQRVARREGGRRRAGRARDRGRRDPVPRRAEGPVGAAPDQRDLHRRRAGTTWTATNSCGTAASGARATPWCCRQDGTSRPARSRPWSR